MNAREVDALLAVRLLGWRWMKWSCLGRSGEPVLTGIVPPAATDREFPNGWARRWIPSNDKAPRFSNWDQPLWWDDAFGHRVLRRGLPHLSTTWDGTGQIVEQMRAKGWPFFELRHQLHATTPGQWRWIARFCGPTDEWAADDVGTMAAALAALKALGEECPR